TPCPQAHTLSPHDALPILMACGGDEEQGAQDPAQSSPTVEEEAGVVPSQEENQPSDVPAEPINPTGTTPSEPPDAGEHGVTGGRSEEHTSELQSREKLVCR